MADFYSYTKVENHYKFIRMLTIFVNKKYPENNLEEEEQGHTTAFTVSEMLAEFAGKSRDVRNLLNAVERLFKFLVVLPASSAGAERSFSTLRRLKNYLRLAYDTRET